MSGLVYCKHYRSCNDWEKSKVKVTLVGIIEAKSSGTWWHEIGIVISNQCFKQHNANAHCEK
jgi:hypothetical protein